MVPKFDINGNHTLARFVYAGKVIDVEQVVPVVEEKLDGNRMKPFNCQSEIAGELERYELKYELQTCKWIVWKM